MSKQFAIGIPTLNRMDLLEPALRIYQQDFSCEIFVLDNGKQRWPVINPLIGWIGQEKNIGVAASWNRLCTTIFNLGYENAAILNDDIMLGFGQAHLQQLLIANPGKFITTIVDWCVFIMPKTVYEKVGPFDENFFPAYYEDKDYERRLKLSNSSIIRSPALSPMVYRSSSTAEKDSSVHVAAHKNKAYFLKKWGGPPGGEKFITPFNEKSKK